MDIKRYPFFSEGLFVGAKVRLRSNHPPTSLRSRLKCEGGAIHEMDFIEEENCFLKGGSIAPHLRVVEDLNLLTFGCAT